MDKIFLAILVLFVVIIFYLNKEKNTWNIPFFNSTLVILALFIIGIMVKDLTLWRYIVVSLAVIAIGEKTIGFFIKDDK